VVVLIGVVSLCIDMVKLEYLAFHLASLAEDASLLECIYTASTSTTAHILRPIRSANIMVVHMVLLAGTAGMILASIIQNACAP
jgi:hypothetical protein